MGILDRFEKGLENVVNGAFAKAFRSQVEPVELAGSLRREADNKAAVVSRGRTLTANHYSIELSPTDFDRLSDLENELRSDLRQVIGDHAVEQAYSFVGPVSVEFVEADDLDTGMYRVVSSTQRPDGSPAAQPANRGGYDPVSRSHNIVGEGQASSGSRPVAPRRTPEAAPARPAATSRPASAPVRQAAPSRSRSIVASVTIHGQDYELRQGTNVFGRSSSSSDYVIDDPGVSRRHFEITVEGDHAVANDLGSTNGTLLRGRKLTSANLSDGDVLMAGDAEVRYHENEQDAQ
ncbi:MAG: FhaA domain-containing protein [Brevibacterium aurantiacum]